MSAVKTPEGILKYANVVEPYRFNKASAAKFHITLCFPNDAGLSELRSAIAEKSARFEDERTVKTCLKSDGIELGYPHAMYLVASNKDRPAITVYDKDLRNETVRTIENHYERFVPGATVRARVRFSSYSSGSNKGVNAYLDGLLLLKDCDPGEPKVMGQDEWD